MEMEDTGKHPDHDFLPSLPLPFLPPSLAPALPPSVLHFLSPIFLPFVIIFSHLIFFKSMAYLSASAVPGKEQGSWW